MTSVNRTADSPNAECIPLAKVQSNCTERNTSNCNVATLTTSWTSHPFLEHSCIGTGQRSCGWLRLEQASPGWTKSNRKSANYILIKPVGTGWLVVNIATLILHLGLPTLLTHTCKMYLVSASCKAVWQLQARSETSSTPLLQHMSLLIQWASLGWVSYTSNVL